MAWIKVKEQEHLNTSENGADDRTARRVFICVSDTDTTTVAAETASDGSTTIPVKPAGHPSDSARKVKSINAIGNDEAPKRVFTVTVDYSSKKDNAENPIDRPAKYKWSFDDGTECYFMDKSSTPKPVINSAGDPFQPLRERDKGSIVCTVTKAVAPGAYSPATAVACKDAVNSDGITVDGESVSANQCKMKGLTADDVQTENGHAFRMLTAVLQFRPSWDDVVEDRGLNQKSTNGTKPIPMETNSPHDTDTQWPLDGSGAPKTNKTDTPATKTFVPYEKIPFSGFGFA